MPTSLRLVVLSACACGGMAMTPVEWAATSRVREYDFSKPADAEYIKTHNCFEDGPILIHNAVAADGPLEALVRFGDTKSLKKDLQQSAKFTGPAGPKGTMRWGVKMSSKRYFSYWDDSSPWLGHETKEKSKQRREWHRWRKKPLTVKYFFQHYEKPGPPYLYWQGNLDPPSIGMDPRPTLCKLFSASFDETACQENTNEGETSAWLNSAGVLAGAHFDVNHNINVQLKGKKKWTLWAPHQLDDLCFYPYIHPATRQVQADLTGEGLGAGCPTAHGIPNRTVVVETGDVLIVPPFYVHRVETLDASINFNTWYEGTESRIHSLVGIALAHAATGAINPKTYPPMNRDCLPNGKQCKKSEEQVAKPRAQASAALRLLAKNIIAGLVGDKKGAEAFLKVTWQTDYSQLPDIELLSSEGSVAKLCREEAELIGGKRRSMLLARAQGVVSKLQQLRGEWHDGAYNGGEARWKSSGMSVGIEHEEMRFVVGALLALAHGNMEVMMIGPIDPAARDGGGSQAVPKVELTPYEDTKAWFDALWRCDNKGGVRKDEL